jgi:pheromone a factor receptor
MDSTNSTLPANKWAVFGFTTTPEERIGPPPPYSSPSLQINLFFRVFLGILSVFLTFVPARLLWRNGEFGGTVICVMLIVNNLITVINALIWRDDNVQDWWAGYGWCDFLTYAFFALHTAFNISLFEIMRGLATKVALNRAVRPTRSERRRQHIISALVIFTVPAIQAILTYWTTISRYNISTLAGCNAIYYPNWIYLVFYILPTPVFAVLAAYAAGE